ncbi:MAG: hypothetical protein QNJ90_10290 [Planctomycetota bacterium]|nr:hypothetical protein [Planctomycetota bacterium]
MAASIRRYLLLALLVTVLVTAALAWPAYAWQGSDGLLGLGLAAAICLLGAMGGRGVGGFVRVTQPGEDQAPLATQAAIAGRLVLTLILSTPVFILKPVEMMPFGIWLGVHYLAQMVLEVFVSLRELGQNRRPTETPARTPQPEATLPTGSEVAAERVDDAKGAADR